MPGLVDITQNAYTENNLEGVFPDVADSVLSENYEGEVDITTKVASSRPENGVIEAGILTDEESEVLALGVAGERRAPEASIRTPAAGISTVAVNPVKTEEGAKPNFFWSFILLIFGTAGLKMYEKHQEKIAARAEGEDKK